MQAFCSRIASYYCGFCTAVVEGWLDLAKLVASEGSKQKSPYDELAYKIGRDVYVDIAGWHLFLRDMSAVPGLKMSQALATKLGPEVRGYRDPQQCTVVSLSSDRINFSHISSHAPRSEMSTKLYGSIK
eukprot:GHUV01035930.1.p1 GENE.GHUV01035930.1~~GHUV01035930.1.p1  ORF type:complete len:129 (+),score=22.50 GHUV01035930.1:423-809(+)